MADFGVRTVGRLLVDENFGNFFKVQEPIGKFQRLGIEQFGPIAKGLAIFVMWIKHDDMAKGVGGENSPEQNGDRAGFAGARGAEDGEMLAEKLVGNGISGQTIGLTQRAETHGCDIRLAVDQKEFVLIGQEYRAVQGGVFGDAALKA